MSGDYEIFVIAHKSAAEKVYGGWFWYNEEDAHSVCRALNDGSSTSIPEGWKVYPAIINLGKEALTDANL
jgi:hypothetical protein